MNGYKFRAENPYDAARLLVLLVDSEIEVCHWRQRDSDHETEVTFDSGAPIDVIRHAIAAIEDGHVMYQTLAMVDDYTGERTHAVPPLAN